MHWLLAHFIGDWLLQPDSIALHKKEDTNICIKHILIYMIPFLVVPGLSALQFMLIAVQHYAIDRTQFVDWILRVTGNNRFRDKDALLYPMGYVVWDQLLHIIWIAIVLGV
jgi:hypothetical protein